MVMALNSQTNAVLWEYISTYVKLRELDYCVFLTVFLVITKGDYILLFIFYFFAIF